MSKFQEYDDSLRKLATEVTRSLSFNKDGSDQKAQVEKLMKLEERFRKSVNKFIQSREAYKQFIIHVAIKNKNILSARPFFREKSVKFSAEITPAIKNADIKKLQSFHINYNLIKFIRDNWRGPFPEKSQELYNKVVEARRRLIENNMPLAINRAKIFYRKTPTSHLSLMDLIGISGAGLVSGVDKWVGEYSRVFNGVCIGRMTGNMIDSYSETVLHFYPSDRSILYRANSLRAKHKVDNVEKLTELINASYEEDRKKGVKTPKEKITPDQLTSLMNAASPYSFDFKISDQGSEDNNKVDKNGDSSVVSGDLVYLDEEADDSAEDLYIKKDAMTKMFSAIGTLPLIEQKILRLKGVRL